jgi:hypothetical protein
VASVLDRELHGHRGNCNRCPAKVRHRMPIYFQSDRDRRPAGAASARFGTVFVSGVSGYETRAHCGAAAYLSVYDAICHDGRCDEFVEGDVPMQFDLGHLTAQGSGEVGRRLSALLVRKVAKVDDVANQ